MILEGIVIVGFALLLDFLIGDPKTKFDICKIPDDNFKKSVKISNSKSSYNLINDEKKLKLTEKEINTIIPFEEVQAHCDIPCKIYDPNATQIAALSVIRFIDLINELDGADAEFKISGHAQLCPLWLLRRLWSSRMKTLTWE